MADVKTGRRRGRPEKVSDHLLLTAMARLIRDNPGMSAREAERRVRTAYLIPRGSTGTLRRKFGDRRSTLMAAAAREMHPSSVKYRDFVRRLAAEHEPMRDFVRRLAAEHEPMRDFVRRLAADLD
jgi:hypothetical protein